MVETNDGAARYGVTTLTYLQDPSRRKCRGRVNGRLWNVVNNLRSFLGHKGLQQGKPWGKVVDWGSVANSEDVDSIFVEDRFELGEESGGRWWWDSAEIIDISIFKVFSCAQPAFGNDVGRSVT